MSIYLVTGGAGFIGSSLARQLLTEGHAVRVLDNLSTGKQENLDEIRSQIDLRIGDLRDRNAVADAMASVDHVFHQGAIPSVPRSVQSPLESHESNATGTLNVLLAARDAGVQRVVYASSSSVYGANQELPKRETMLPEPQSPYAVSKLSGEQYCLVFNELYELETVALRYFNVFGPRQDPASPYSGVISRFIDAIRQEKSPTIFGSGEQTRDFTYIDNVVDANLAACRAKDAAGHAFNVGVGRRISVIDLWKQMATITGTALKAVYRESRPGDVLHSVADTSRAREALGFDPRVDLEAGLVQTLRFYGLCE